MALRGQAAIVGIGELPTARTYPGRSTLALLAEASRLAIEDAGLLKEQIDGVLTRGEEVNPLSLAEYMHIRPVYYEGVTLHGASGATSVAMAAAAIHGGLASAVLCVFGGTRDPEAGGFQTGGLRGVPRPVAPSGPANAGTEWEAPFGPQIAANGGYGLVKHRHMYEYGTTQEQFAKIAADERFNAVNNPNAEAMTDGTQGHPVFEIFSAMAPNTLEVVVAPIDLECDREKGQARIQISGIGESRIEPIKNPVTGEEHRVRINLPNGFEYKVADICNSVHWRTTAGDKLTMEHENSYAQLARIDWSSDGTTRHTDRNPPS